jgi:UDP-N-acetylmuramoyl-L-alanyl-D-glutamate--2,6-diaminopimelate ligase
MMAAELRPSVKTLGMLLGAEAGPLAGLAITDLVLDSRQVTRGAAFIAMRGARAHGLDFAAESIVRGAAVVLYEPSVVHDMIPAPSLAVPGLRLRLGELARAFFGAHRSALTAVTGTNGKTTVAYLIAQALTGLRTARSPAPRSEPSLGPGTEPSPGLRTAPAPRTACAYIGTLGFGIPPALTPHELTTPDCLTLHRELATLGAPRAVLEVSSHALEQERIAGLDIDTAVFTNLTRDHLDQHRNMASYARAKGRLFQRPELRHIVLNANDPFSSVLARTAPPSTTILRVGVASPVESPGREIGGLSEERPPGEGIAGPSSGHEPLDLAAEILHTGLDGTKLAISGRCGAAELSSTLIGEFNAENLVLALGALLARGMPLSEACAALENAHAPAGRMERIGGSARQPVVIVDYAHTPDALQRVLAALKRLAPGELWCVFGCGGERDRGKRPLMGAAAARFAEHIVLTDDNPRGEDPAAIVSEIRAGLGAHASVTTEHDRAAAIELAIHRAGPSDVVLIAGKGHEASQLKGKHAQPFSDRAAALEALGGRP